MKRALLLLLAVAGTQFGTAEELDSNVIHHYRYVGVGYNYFYSDQMQLPDGHGISAFGTYEFENFLFGVGGGKVQGENRNVELETWDVQGNVGYVIRLLENHLNLIPSFGIGYSETTETLNLPFFPFVVEFGAESTGIVPGLAVSYAFNQYLSLNAGYSYGYDLDAHDGAHGLSVGAECALTKKVGLGVGAHFDPEEGFMGLNAGLSFHF